jgi:Helicase conserved C-terminal domain
VNATIALKECGHEVLLRSMGFVARRYTMNRRDFLTQVVFSGDRRLLPHQVEQAIFAVERARSLNASETGTGKFLVALAMRRLVEREAGHIAKYLHTCPKTALGQFEQEFIDHGYRTFVLRHGNDVIPADVDTVLVANSAMVVTHRDQLRNWCPLLVVLDEAVAFKTATAARTKAVYGDALDGAGGIIDGVRFVLAMSGTLAPGHNGELYPHLRALAPAALNDERGRIMRRHIFEKTFCVFGARRVAGGREVQVIVGSRNSNLLRKRIDPYVARATLREIAPTLPPERHERVPIAREDVKLDELAAIADIEDAEIRIAVETLTTAIRDGLVPTPDIDREMTRLMEMLGGGTALAHLRRAYGLAKLPYAEDVVMSRRGGNGKERTPTLIFNTYRMTGDRLEALLRDQDVMVGRIHGNTSSAERHAVVAGIQDGSIEAAILQIDAAGSALNLQAANRIIMLEPSWAPGTNHQAVARAVRIGQHNPVLVSWPVVRHSIDEAVMRVLRRKQDGLTELWRAAS